MIEWEYVAGIIVALGGFIAALMTQIMKLKRSSFEINLREDAQLYERMRHALEKQDARITQLEERVEMLLEEVRICEVHRAECETRLEFLAEEVKRLASKSPGDS